LHLFLINKALITIKLEKKKKHVFNMVCKNNTLGKNTEEKILHKQPKNMKFVTNSLFAKVIPPLHSCKQRLAQA